MPRPFARHALDVSPADGAIALLGALLIRVDGDVARIGRIVEVEAYGGEDDAASHARFGRTDRNRAMYGPPGHAYVYRVYGMHHCLNVVIGPEGRAAAVLVRGVEPVPSLDAASLNAMRAARVRATAAGRRVVDPARDAADAARIGRLPATSLASGPALVAAAFSVAIVDDGLDLCAATSALRLGREVPLRASTRAAEDEIVTSGPRIGVGYASPPWDTMPWRFWLAGSAAVSRPRGEGRGAGLGAARGTGRGEG